MGNGSGVVVMFTGYIHCSFQISLDISCPVQSAEVPAGVPWHKTPCGRPQHSPTEIWMNTFQYKVEIWKVDIQIWKSALQVLEIWNVDIKLWKVDPEFGKVLSKYKLEIWKFDIQVDLQIWKSTFQIKA